jgi:hypothetical protein
MLKHLIDKVVMDVDSNKVYQLNVSDYSFKCLPLDKAYVKNGNLYRYTNDIEWVSATKPILIEDITPYLHLII